jgi:iron complex outermembrane receptor protein
MYSSISIRRAGLAAVWITVAYAGGSAQAQDASSDVKTLKKVTVAADEEGAGVTPPSESASSKTDIPLLENPQAISVVTSESIRERNITRLADALTSVAGVSRSSTYGYYDSYTIRGYDAAYNSIFLDGLTLTNVAGANNELAGLERVEIIKGAASALYGTTPLGGIVNLVSKRPRDDGFLEASVATGSYDLFAASIDANSPLNDSGSLLGRLNVLYRDADDFVDFSGENRIFIAPAVTWKIAERTRLTLLGRYQRDHDNPWSPVNAYGTVLPAAFGKLPIDFAVNYTGDFRAKQNQDRKQIGYAFDHVFDGGATFTQNVRYGETKTFWNNWNFSDDIIDSELVDGVQQSHVWGLNVYGPFHQSDKDLAIDSRGQFTLELGGSTHQLMAGVDFKRNRNRSRDDGGNFDTSMNTIDVLNPDYHAPLLHDPIWAYASSSKSKQLGYYVQDHIGFGEQVFVTLNGRYDDVDVDGVKEHAFSPNVGVNYLITPSIALYSNWSKSFTPQFGYVVDVDGNTLPPERGRNLEAGVKFGDQSQAFNASIAVFQLTRQNVANEDPENPFFYVTTGEQRSRGVELEGGWSPTPAWSFSWAYTYLDAVITKDFVYPTGVQLSNVPKHNLYLYGKYEIQQGALRQLSLSVAGLHNTRKNGALAPFDYDGDGDADPAVPLPKYTLVDAVLSYPINTWTATLSVNNVFDKRYFPDAGGFTRVTPGEPRNWQFTLRHEF